VIEPADRALLGELLRVAPRSLDLTSGAQLEAVRELAEQIESARSTLAARRALEAELMGLGDEVPISIRLGLKLAMSRGVLGELAEPVHASIVFAVYKEHHRIRTAQEHEHGEDLLRRKLWQLHWLFDGTPRHTWDLTVVDDGCPEGSGRLAQAVLDAMGPAQHARVLFLVDAIRDGRPIVRSLASTDDSRKGGSIRLGLWTAVQETRPNHVVLFTDADLSTHLGQLGLLLDPILRDAKNSAIGSRREPASVVVKGGARNTRGKLFIYLWKKLIPQLRGIIDTQCGFKAFRASDIRTWIEDTLENGFAFDIEFLLRVHLAAPGSIAKVPIAWIDSEAESTTAELDPYLPMLRSVVRFYRHYLPSDPRAESFARLIESLDEDSFSRLLEDIPEAIASGEPLEFDALGGVSAEDLAARAFE
jgi:hypothetical protein